MGKIKKIIMKISEYIGGIKEFYHILLIFLEKPDILEQDYQNLFEIIQQKKYEEDRYEFKNFVQLLISISENHHDDANFSTKIEKILLHFAQAAKRFFSNPKIFSICKSSKRILQLFIEKNIIEIDQNITNEIISMDYCHFFYFEIENFIDAEFKNGLLAKEPSFSHNFYEKRKKGENESYICSLIRNDLVEEFISYVNKTNYPLSSEIEKSIFETNSFLFDRKTTLIEYSAFFGSIQIFQYLKMNNVELKSSLWLYAIHSNNPELIHLLEENEVEAPNQKYEECFLESIKCHHNDIARYIEDNFLQDKDDNH